MATAVRELGVKITGDASGFESAMASAAVSTEKLQASLEDASGTDITPQLQLSRMNRDIANLNKVLDGIERRKADPDIGADLTKLLAQEKRVRSELAKLESASAEIEVELDVQGTAAANGGLLLFSGGLEQAKAGAANLGAQLPVLGRALGAIGRAGPAGAAAAAILAVGAAAVFAAVKLGLMAASVEQTKIQLEILAGSEELGGQLFADLQEYAATTPFFFDEITASARRLLAAGVSLKELPGYLEDLGNIAAVTGVPLEQIATVFGQMESKGRATYEELQQLAEAGIPVWRELADAMGLSVAETQKLATEGKLSLEAVRGVRDVLGETYGGTTQRMAETFNGQMSTLKDTLTQMGQQIGAEVLPLMKDFGTIAVWLAGQLAEVIDATIAWLKENEQVVDLLVTGLLGPLKTVADGVGWLADKINEDGAPAASSMSDALDEAAISTEGWIVDLELLNESLVAVIDTQLAARQASRNLGKVLKDQAGFTLKAKQAVNQAADAYAKHAQAMVDDGASARRVRKYLDEASASIKAQARQAGISKDELNKYLDRLGFTPKKLETKLEVDNSEADKQLAATKKELEFLERQNYTIPVKVDVQVTGDVDRAARLGVGTSSVDSSGVGVSAFAATSFASSVTGRPRSAGGTITVKGADSDVVELAPKSTPVKVYLDGAEIAARVSGRYSPSAPSRPMSNRRP